MHNSYILSIYLLIKFGTKIQLFLKEKKNSIFLNRNPNTKFTVKLTNKFKLNILKKVISEISEKKKKILT